MSDSPTWNELDAIRNGKSDIDLAEEIWRLRRRAEVGTKWIPVGERRPEPYETVLLNCDGELRSTGFWDGSGKRGNGWKVDADHPADGAAWVVTHWMPLPSPPMNHSLEGEKRGT